MNCFKIVSGKIYKGEKMHLRSVAADKLLDHEFKVLTDGFVRLVDYMGTDKRITQAARVSYHNVNIERSNEDNKKLIFYLMKNGHTSPFEQVVLVFHCKLPIFVARQWIRHRTARVNELSGRYSELPREMYLPHQERLGKQGIANKQGTEGIISRDDGVVTLNEMAEVQSFSYGVYRRSLKRGILKEVARINLPLSIYTEWYWQIDLHNLFHFLNLRLDEHAQWEIRQYAQVIADITKVVVPVAYEAFEEHILNAVTLSWSEANELRALLHLKNINVKVKL